METLETSIQSIDFCNISQQFAALFGVNFTFEKPWIP